MKLTRLEVEALRGIPKGWPPVPISEKGLVIYGPNASGKSSIIDGIEFALQKESSLFAENRQGVNWEKGSQHIRGGAKRAELFGKHQGIEYSLSNSSAAPPEVGNWKARAAEATFVLRRHMLLKFISSPPADRYGSLESFFNLQSYSGIEAKLLSLVNSAKTVESGLEVTVTSKTQALRVALGLSPMEVVNTAVAEAKLTSALEGAGLKQASTNEERAERKSEISAELQGLAADARLTELSTLKSHLSELLPSATFDGMLGQLGDLQDALKKARDESVAKAPADFLRAAKRIIEGEELDDCPVCEQAIDRLGMASSLEARITKDSKVTEAEAALKRHKTAILTPIATHAAAFAKLLGMWQKAFHEDLPKAYADEAEFLKELVRQLQQNNPVSNLQDVRARLKATVGSHLALIDRVTSELASEGGERRAALSKILELLDVVQTEFASYAAARRHLGVASKTRALLERVHGHALQARRSAVQKIVDRLAALANEYYELIHPGEEISQSSLEIRQVGRGSVELSTSFHGQNEHPLLHFSESHLDTLGLCYFLAARRLESDDHAEFKLLVLDDVVHSVDSDHRERVARLLKEKFADHQLVIVTHDSVFFQRLRANLGSGFEYISFTNWSLDAGPVRIQGSTDIDRVTSPELRNSMSPEELGAAAGRFAESLFMQLTERLQVAVPARFSRPHDIGNLWPPLAAKLKKHKFFGSMHKLLVEQLESSQWVRNKVGAHYNELESPVTPAEVRTFAESLSELYRVTTCQACCTTIAKVDDDHWQCKCGGLRYAAALAANDDTTNAA